VPLIQALLLRVEPFDPHVPVLILVVCVFFAVFNARGAHGRKLIAMMAL
jgi:hypothetical protein